MPRAWTPSTGRPRNRSAARAISEPGSAPATNASRRRSSVRSTGSASIADLPHPVLLLGHRTPRHTVIVLGVGEERRGPGEFATRRIAVGHLPVVFQGRVDL